jgi:FlaA1/EpsC-like NDP-sugar epimerase
MNLQISDIGRRTQRGPNKVAVRTSHRRALDPAAVEAALKEFPLKRQRPALRTNVQETVPVAAPDAPASALAAYRKISFGLYAPHHLSALEEFPRIFSASSIGIVLLVMTSFWTKAELSRIWIAAAWIGVLLLELGARKMWRYRVDSMKAKGKLSLRTLIIGTNEEAGRLSATFRVSPDLGFLPVAYVPATDNPPIDNHLPMVRTIDLLPDTIRELKAECLFIASSAVTPEDMLWPHHGR